MSNQDELNEAIAATEKYMEQCYNVAADLTLHELVDVVANLVAMIDQDRLRDNLLVQSGNGGMVLPAVRQWEPMIELMEDHGLDTVGFGTDENDGIIQNDVTPEEEEEEEEDFSGYVGTDEEALDASNLTDDEKEVVRVTIAVLDVMGLPHDVHSLIKETAELRGKNLSAEFAKSFGF